MKTQISQAQSRANSAVPAILNGREKEVERSRAETLGKAHATVTGAIRENEFEERETGTVETGDGPGCECLAAQQPVFMPQWQEGAALATLTSAACVSAIFMHASTRLQTIASAVFMGTVSGHSAHRAKPILAGICQFLVSFSAALLAASIFFMYLAGSFSKSFLQSGQHSFTS